MLLSGIGTLHRHGRMRIILWRSFLYGNDRGQRRRYVDDCTYGGLFGR